MIGMFIMLGLGGMILGLIAGFSTGGILGAIAGLFAGFMPFLAVMQIIGYAKQKGFLALFKTLEENEKYGWVPNKMNKLMCMVFKKTHPGVIYKKGLGVFEDKGTEFSLGNSPMSFVYPHSAYTVDFPTIHFFSLLERDKEADDYEECIREYLGEDEYKIFWEKFRAGKVPDFYSIQNELDYLIRHKPNNDNGLSKNVFGETVDFRNRLKYLRYNYDPITADNATERERIIALKEGMDYRDTDKYVSRAKAIVMIIFGIMVFLIVVSVIDFSAIGGIFGG